VLGDPTPPYLVNELLEVPRRPLRQFLAAVWPTIAHDLRRRGRPPVDATHQRLEHAAALGARVVRARLGPRAGLGHGLAEPGLDGADHALLDHGRWQPVQRALEGVSGIHPLAIDPCFAVLPVHVVAQQQAVELVNVGIARKHYVASPVERESLVHERAAPAPNPLLLFDQHRLGTKVIRGAQSRRPGADHEYGHGLGSGRLRQRAASSCVRCARRG